MRPTTILTLGLLAAIWTHAAVVYPTLPARIPVHFGIGGAPDRFSHHVGAYWFAIPVLATVSGLATAIGVPRLTDWLARSNSSYLNIPHKARFRALPEAARVRVVQASTWPVAWIAIELTALFAFIQLATARIAHEDWQTIPGWPMWTTIALISGTAMLPLWTTGRAIDRELAGTSAQRIMKNPASPGSRGIPRNPGIPRNHCVAAPAPSRCITCSTSPLLPM